MSDPHLDLSYIAGFVHHADAVFERVQASIAFEHRMAARETASFGLAYDYSGVTYPDVAMPELIRELAERIAAVVGHPMTNCLANRYPTGDSKMGYHADSYASLAETSRIAIVSLGSTRTISFRRNDPREVVRALELEPGSLLVMGPSVQESYKHAVLPAPGAGCRVSLTFRYVEP